MRTLIAVGVAMELCYLSFYAAGEGPGEVLLFIAVNAATYLLLSFLLWRMRPNRGNQDLGRRITPLAIAFGLLFRLTLVPHGVVGSDDVYRYLWDGKVAASGINPYRYLPTDPELAHLASADLPAKVNHPELRSVYPPLAQSLFLLSHWLFGESAAGMKVLLVVLDGLTILLLWRLLRERGGSALPLVLYAWSPLPILYFGLDGHIDALGILLLVLSLLFFLTRRPVRGAVALGLGALAKLVPLIVVPLLFRAEKGFRRVLVPAVPLLVVLLGYLLFLEPTGGIFGSLWTFGSRWEFNGGIFSVVYFLTGSNETAHLVSTIAIALWIGIIAILRRPLLEKVFWGLAGFILLSPVVHPWYLTWLAALLVLRWSTSIFVFLGLSCLANVVVYQYRAFGAWNDQPLLLVLEYLPVFLLLTREFVRGEVLRQSSVSQNRE
jgi:alpha-1,6-mannosyltransferase